VKPSKKEKKELTPYGRIPKDGDGFIDAKLYKPQPFFLLWMILENRRTIPGWWTGSRFEGYRLKSTDAVIRWKNRQN
jgi:hypothetical protein